MALVWERRNKEQVSFNELAKWISVVAKPDVPQQLIGKADQKQKTSLTLINKECRTDIFLAFSLFFCCRFICDAVVWDSRLLRVVLICFMSVYGPW